MILPIHIKRKSDITTALIEVAGDEGTVVPISVKLVQASGPNSGFPIPGKNVHFVIGNTELGVVTSNASGDAPFIYTANIADDGLNVQISYLGD